MIVYYSILIFTCVVAFFGCFIQAQKQKKIITCGGLNNQNSIKQQKSIPLFFAIFSFALLVFFVGMRTNFSDTYLYVLTFKNQPYQFSDMKELLLSDSTGKGFEILLMLFKHFVSTNYTVWFFFLAIFQIGAIIKVYYKYSPNFFMSAYLFIASGTFTWMMNGTRQFLAATLILYFFDALLEKKTIKFLIVVLIAATIHSSALIWIPVYFIVHFKPWSKQIIICIVLTLLVVVFVNQFTSLLDDMLVGTDYDGLAREMKNYDDGVNFIRVLVAAVPPFIALWRRKYIKDISPKYIDIMTNMSVTGVGVYLIGVVTSGVMIGRLPIYITMCNYVLLPWLINNAFGKVDKKIVKLCCYVLYFAYFYYSFVTCGVGYYISTILGVSV